MSLRSFHIFFIIVSLGLLSFMAAWSVQRVLEGAAGFSIALALFSVIGLAAGLPYLQWFLRQDQAEADA
ncbi:MAG: hypothetical protein COB53_10975 [Elusimicrobia bacterium]|nr:MAG: hypothetical protein COB53_10975 [Elusimicrobiota bacterium]